MYRLFLNSWFLKVVPYRSKLQHVAVRIIAYSKAANTARIDSSTCEHRLFKTVTLGRFQDCGSEPRLKPNDWLKWLNRNA